MYYYFWALVFTFLVAMVGMWMVTSSKRSGKKLPPPGPWRFPIIGNLHQMMMMSYTHHHLPPHQRLSELAQKKYGPVMRLQLGELTNIFISSAEAAEQVLKTHDLVFTSRPFNLSADIIFYGCKDLVFAPYGEHWRQLRKVFVMELLSVKRVLSFRPIRLEEVANFIASISESAGKGHVVELKPMLLSLANTITSRSALGKAPKLSQEFVRVVENIISSLGSFRLSDFFPSFKLLPILSGFRSQLIALHRTADLVLDEVINEHITKRRGTSDHGDANNSDNNETEDFVDILLNLQQNPDTSGSQLTMDALKALLLDVFLAGTDTSSTIIEWTMSEIMKNPSVMQKVQQEIRSVFHDNVNEEDLEKLEYLNAVIKETFRLHPPGPFLLPKEVGEKVEINGFEIPKKSQIIVNLWALGRDPCCWTEAEKFNPERFLNSTMDYAGTHFGFIPFGAGRRMCPGTKFGMAIVQLTLANLLFHFDWKLPSGIEPENLDMTELFGVSIRKKEKLCIIPMARTT